MPPQNPNRSARGLFFWLLVLLVVLPGALFLLASAGLLLYIYWPVDLTELTLPELDTRAQHVVVISHGLGDDPSIWSDGVKDALEARDELAQVISLDWNPYSRNALRCSVDGKRLGESLGGRLAANPNLKSLHLVAHSCGSFVSLGICESLRTARSPGAAQGDVQIQSTYLDPVTVYGGIFWSFGLERFGSCADFSDAYINASDDVPGSNQLLPFTHTFDVTDLRIPSGYMGSSHLWPTAFYQRLVESGNNIELHRDSAVTADYPRNVLTTLQP